MYDYKNKSNHPDYEMEEWILGVWYDNLPSSPLMETRHRGLKSENRGLRTF